MKHLTFKQDGTSESGVTKKWIVRSAHDESPNPPILGTIKYYPQWRKYAFFPTSETLYDTQCMAELISFLLEHKHTGQDK